MEEPHPAPPPRWPRAVWTVLMALLILGAGVSIGLLIPTLRAPDDDSAAAGFARDMSDHHAQAIEMALIARDRSTDPEIRTMALDIALAQQGQNGMMQTWLKQWNLPLTSNAARMQWMTQHHKDRDTPPLAADGLMPGMATTAEVDQLRRASGRAFDRLFITLMTRHHEGGIDMVDAVLAAGPPREVTELAQSMKSGQAAEIRALRAVADRLG